MSFRASLLRSLGLGALALAPLGCERLANVQLTLVEPCDQRSQALAGVQTFRVTVGGGFIDERVTTFTRDKGPQPLLVDQLVEGAVITVEAWEGNAEENPAVLSSPPKAIGRTMPLEITNTTRDMEITVTMGRLDGVGQTTAADGSCQLMNNGESVVGRHGHTATFVPGLNKVLVVGGAVFVDDPQSGGRAESYLRSVELFDPATGTFEPIANMQTTRAYHTATLLPNGKVLIAGGFGVIGGVPSALSSALVFDPEAPTDNPYTTANLSQERALHTATLLEEAGLVVLVGGCAGPGCRSTGVQNVGGGAGDPTTLRGNTIEVYDIANARFVAQPGLLAEARAMHAASALEGGRVLVSGGVNAGGPVCSVEIFEAHGANLVDLQEPGLTALPACPSRHVQVTLGRDRVAILGGQTEAPGGVPQGAGSNQVVFWNTAVGVEAVQGSLLTGRAGHQATLLEDGSILVLGGAIAAGGATVERLSSAGTSAALVGPPLRDARDRLAIAPLPSNQVFVSGGHTADLVTVDSAEVYFGD